MFIYGYAQVNSRILFVCFLHLVWNASLCSAHEREEVSKVGLHIAVLERQLFSCFDLLSGHVSNAAFESIVE